jgi:tripartite-type tricarboxylate transporter receptor subunit TctC
VKVIAAVAALVFTGAAFAQAYPAKPIRIVISNVPGSGPDLIVRKALPVLSPRLGQALIIENRPGGNNVIAASACAKAAPDGYTLCNINPGIMFFNQLMMADLPYDAERDLKPVVNLFYYVSGIFSNTALGAGSLKELAALAASKPGGLNFGILHGPANAVDIARQWLGERWNAKLQEVPYKGGNLIIAALVSGEIDLTWIGLANVGGQMKSGRIRLHAVDSLSRFRPLPNVPTFDEVGLGPAPARRGWFGIAMPTGVPEDAVMRINGEFTRLLRDPEISRLFDEQGVETAPPGTPQEYAALIASDRAAAVSLLKK